MIRMLGRAALVAARVPDYETPERAVRAFMYLVRYRQSQDLTTRWSSLSSGRSTTSTACSPSGARC